VRVRFDQGTPVPLREYLPKHQITTTRELSWHELKNGDLLTKAETAGFDVFVTTDQSLRYQQNLLGRRLAIAVLMTTSWPRIARHLTAVAAQIDELKAGQFIEMPIP
jgi:carbamoylphosphate synthase large subunit